MTEVGLTGTGAGHASLPRTAPREVRPGELIRGNTVLPASREALTLVTSDGLELVGELALPADRPPVATLLCLHPLPEGGGGGTPGGSMDSHLLRKAAWRLPALAGVAVLRLNTRGTRSAEGTSQGSFGDGYDEKLDLAAALDLAESRDLPAVWLLGWSFGTEVILRWGSLDPTPVGAILLAPPLKRAGDAELDLWAADGRPLVAVVPEHDDYLLPPEARERFARVPQARVIEVVGSKHLFVGYTEEVLDIVAATVIPGIGLLPRTWDVE